MSRHEERTSKGIAFGQLGGRVGRALPLALVLALVLAPGPRAEPAGASDAASNRQIETAPSAPVFTLTARGSSISLDVKEVPLGDVLARLAEQTDIEIFAAEAILNDAFSDSFEDLPLDAALERLLASKDYVVRYAQDQGSGVPRPAAVYVVGSDDAQANRMVAVARRPDARPPQMDRDAVLLEIGLRAEKAAARATALKKYLDEADDPDYELVAKALKDPDPRVRKVALVGMEDSNTLPAEATAEAAVSDGDPALRMNALRILVERTGGKASEAIQQALQDPDPEVRAHAEEMAKVAESIDRFYEKQRLEIEAEAQAKTQGENPADE